MNRQPPSSKRRYLDFVRLYRSRKLDAADEAPSSPPAGVQAPRASLLEYLRWLKRHRPAIAAVALLALVTAGLQMIEPLFLRFIVDRVLLRHDLADHDRLWRVNVAGGLFLLAIVLSNVCSAARDYRQRILNVRVMISLRRALFDRLLRLPLPSLWEMKTGGILSRLTGDVDTTTGLLQMAVISPAISVLRLLIALAILFTLNWRLALTAMAIIPGAVLSSFVFARRVRPIYRSLRRDAEQIDGRAGETFSGIRVVRGFARELRELRDYVSGRHAILRKEMFAQRRELLLWGSWSIVVSAVNVVIVWYGGILNVRGGASIGDIMAFQWYTFLLLNPVWAIVNSFSDLQRSLAATERVFAVLAMPPDKPDRAGATDAPRTVREIEFREVTFEYQIGQPVVRDFTLRVAGGSVVALVGRSGAGKTTVTDLVARFHDPTQGAILLNGVDLRDFHLRSYRALLGLVQQSVFLFDGTIRDNIAYGRLDATDAEIEEAARRANAHEFIDKMSRRYDTVVGERGVKLSGGQQQRLAIARAFLASPQILILDEATSNLDSESEQLIQAAMADLLAGRTTFVIAHRLSTIRRADQILLMDNGRIVEQGTHDDLMAKRGDYWAMVRRQAEISAGENAVFAE